MHFTPTTGRHGGTINIAVTWELNYWATRLGLSPDQLITVVAEVGNNLADVREAVFGPAPRGFGEAPAEHRHRDPLAAAADTTRRQ
ncbi:DUF3606 domain-containing protein [Tahibacter caeni]|uniref:DUF3606 domain-containing protein n=1 Tax=Tahibacter caeni TaxID=1453545 RepID=UPI00214899B1|nr:DUF3606 domain-containing protein [Tahibacter caeni]